MNQAMALSTPFTPCHHCGSAPRISSCLVFPLCLLDRGAIPPASL